MPKRFAFRLEALLRHRKRIEDEKAGALARATQIRLQAESALQAILDEQADLLRRRAALQAAGQFVAMDLEEYVVYLQALQGRERERRRLLDQERHNEEAARQELVKARQEREILDRLKQNQHLAYLKEMDRAEAQQIDELATEAYARRILGIEG